MGLIEHLRKSYKLLILTSKLGEFKEGHWRNGDVECHKIPAMNRFFSISYNFFYSWNLLKFLQGVDFIHCFFDFPYCLLPFWLPFFKKPVFITAHGTYSVMPFDRFKTKFFIKRAYKKAKKIFCVSNFTEKSILERVETDNTVVINNGIEYEKFLQPSLEKVNKGNKEKIILSVGVLKPRKGYHVSIPAVAKVKETYPNIKYYIVGGEPTKFYLELVRENKLEKTIEFLKDLSDNELIRLYYRCDLFLLTPVIINNNEFEGFGQVYLEAGACGKPVIGTYNCGAEDAIVDGVTGFLVPQNDIGKTSEVILKLLNSPELTERMGKNGKKRAQQMTWGNMVKKYIEIYSAL